MTMDLLTGLIAFVLTLVVFSYLLGDNPLFRIAVYTFVGASAGYVAGVAWHQVLRPLLFDPLIGGSATQRLLALVPLILGLLLLTKVSPRLSRLGSPSVAYLVGVGAAVAIGGAVLGTLFPQGIASVRAFDLSAAQSPAEGLERLITASVMLVGVIGTLAYFHFGARPGLDEKPRRNPLVEALAWVGQMFIAITFGVLFAGAYAAALTALIERLSALWMFIGSL